MVILRKMFLNPRIKQGKDRPKDKKVTPHREMQGHFFLCRRMVFSTLIRINYNALVLLFGPLLIDDAI
ncbi:hypothetical protein D7Y41_26315 [Anaerotruncus sp. 1XD22-93]|nr:hypothetical protein [Anaerotruncus sp. 1XD42-93]RKJ80774.1 hypothetical protein D7Y41_26315 [Anaerotruncus sp. 1XD22-93]